METIILNYMQSIQNRLQAIHDKMTQPDRKTEHAPKGYRRIPHAAPSRTTPAL